MKRIFILLCLIIPTEPTDINSSTLKKLTISSSKKIQPCPSLKLAKISSRNQQNYNKTTITTNNYLPKPPLRFPDITQRQTLTKSDYLAKTLLSPHKQ